MGLSSPLLTSIPFLPWVKGCIGGFWSLLQKGWHSPLSCLWGGWGAEQRRPSGCSKCEIFQGLINLI